MLLFRTSARQKITNHNRNENVIREDLGITDMKRQSDRFKNLHSLFPTTDFHSFSHSSMALQPFVGPWPLLQFRNLVYTGGRTPWTSDQHVARPLPTQRTTQTQNKRSQTSMPWEAFGPTFPAFEGAKTVGALGRPATVIGTTDFQSYNIQLLLTYYLQLIIH
jgi:hypothetical protein